MPPREYDARVLRPAFRPAAAVGATSSTASTGAATSGARPRLWDRPRHRGTCSGSCRKGHVVAVDGSRGDGRARRANASATGRGVARRPGRAGARPARRRDPLDRDAPLGRRPRPALARLYAALRPGGLLRRPMRRGRQHGQRAGGDRRRRPPAVAAGPAVEVRRPARDRGSAWRTPVHRRPDLAAGQAGRAGGPAGVLPSSSWAPTWSASRGTSARRSSRTCRAPSAAVRLNYVRLNLLARR